MKKTFWFLIALTWLLIAYVIVGAAPPAAAQSGPVTVRPDCFQFFTFTAAANSFTFDNRSAGCPFWAISYSATGFSAVSLVVQVAPDNAGAPGAWVTYTASSGVNPNTATDQNSSQFIGYFPWVRVQLTSATGTGSLSGIVYGWRVPPAVIGGTPAIISGTVQTQGVGNASVLSGQQAVTGSAAALPSHATRGACIKALIGNTINVYVGTAGVTTGSGFELDPGSVVCLPVANTNLLFVVASTTGASVSWVETN